MISDKYDESKPLTKSLIAGVGASVAFPFILYSFSFSPEFWSALTAYGIAYLLSEAWYGPTVSMFLVLFPSKLSGMSIAVFILSGGILSSIANIALGSLGDYYDAKNNP